MLDKPSHISELPTDEDLIMLLRHGAPQYRCGVYLAHLTPLQRQSIYHDLESERLRRKCLDMKKLYDATKQNWNQVMFIIFMRALSDEDNRQNFMEIAHRIDFNTLLREKSSAENIELMLLGTSGLLPLLKQTPFVKAHSEKAQYLIRKYNIMPLTSESWEFRKYISAELLLLRLTQVAQTIFSNNMLFNKMTSCRSRDDLFSLFNIEASEQWQKEFNYSSKYKVPRYRCDLIGINLIVPLLYAYGFYTSDDAIVTVAGDLNESIPAESNTYIRQWREYGLTPVSAFETQALLQLARVYCQMKRCSECYLYRHICSHKETLREIPIFIDHQR